MQKVNWAYATVHPNRDSWSFFLAVVELAGSLTTLVGYGCEWIGVLGEVREGNEIDRKISTQK